MKNYYPAFIDIEGQPCLVVGGGPVAEQKAAPLLDCGARVTVVSPDLTPALRRHADEGRIRWMPRPYRPGDVADYRIVVCATDDAGVNAQAFKEAEERHILVNVVDVPSLCRFIAPSVVRRGDLCIAISTGGKSPAMAKKIRQQLEEQFGPEYASLLDLLGRYRPAMKARHPDEAARLRLWQELVESDLIDLLRDGKMDEAQDRVEACISRS